MQTISCRASAAENSPVTAVPEVQFTALRRIILDILAKKNVKLSELPSHVRDQLSAAQLRKYGRVRGTITIVRQELEVRGEIQRLPRVSPPMLMLSPELQGRTKPQPADRIQAPVQNAGLLSKLRKIFRG